MAVTALLFGNLFETVFRGEIDWDDDTIKVALTTSAYTPSQTTHDYFNDVTNEVTGTGYTADGATLGTKTSTLSSNTFTLDAADITSDWTTSTITARIAVVHKDTGTASTSPLICYVDAGADVSTTAGTFSILWHADGIVKIVVT